VIDLPQILLRLTANAQVFTLLLAGVSESQARWRPSADDWSLLEVINHLHDEEREDFRQRTQLLLLESAVPWPPIHPGAWVTERGYNQRHVAQSLQAFLAERTDSIAWLKGLHNPNWESFAIAPWGSPFKAGDMLAAWLAHDHLHIRQLNELHYLWHAQQAKPYEVGYAGDW
jgi:DinB superfamily